MPSSQPDQRYRDILANIDAAVSYIDGLVEEDFLANQLVQDASKRCLQRISEAASKLGALAEVDAPDVPWGQIRSIGNFLRHEYDHVDQPRIFEIIRNDLPALRKAVQAVLDGKARRE